MSRNNIWYRIVTNEYLGVTRKITGATREEVELKAAEQLRKWREREDREREKERISNLKRLAGDKTQKALRLIEEYRGILGAALSRSSRIEWERLYHREPYKAFTFDVPEPTIEEVYRELQVPGSSALELIFRGLRTRRIEREEAARRALAERMERHSQMRESQLRAYEAAKKAYEERQLEHNKKIDAQKNAFEAKEPSAIEEYFRLVLESSPYPEGFRKDFEVQYTPLSGTLVIDYQLPGTNDLPRTVEHRYSPKNDEVKEILMKQKEFDAFYESVLYQVVLRTIHEVYQADYVSAVKTVVLNGWVNGTDRATGKAFRSCTVSCQTDRDEFLTINLAKVDPKQCFRSLKGLSAGPLHELAPVRPIMQIDRDDKRFVEARDILAEVNSIPNLATMDWEDFEHLVRGLFEKIFSQESSEVKITRASRDWGVDAIAFDPDPIRGGKFVIQAKRYNDIVPVSAVRDLYGTMINEGASRGILVTTAYYGPESREFAKDKPITLIDGSNLVYMLSQHGYKARVELKK